MDMKIVTFEQLVERLGRAIHYDCGMQGLKTLLYGWRMHCKYFRKPSIAALQTRKKEAGRYFLTYEETLGFSQYCGYDLTKEW